MVVVCSLEVALDCWPSELPQRSGCSATTFPGEDIAFSRNSFCIFLNSSACWRVRSLFLILTSFLHILNIIRRLAICLQLLTVPPLNAVKLDANLLYAGGKFLIKIIFQKQSIRNGTPNWHLKIIQLKVDLFL